MQGTVALLAEKPAQTVRIDGFRCAPEPALERPVVEQQPAFTIDITDQRGDRIGDQTQLRLACPHGALGNAAAGLMPVNVDHGPQQQRTGKRRAPADEKGGCISIEARFGALRTQRLQLPTPKSFGNDFNAQIQRGRGGRIQGLRCGARHAAHPGEDG